MYESPPLQRIQIQLVDASELMLLGMTEESDSDDSNSGSGEDGSEGDGDGDDGEELTEAEARAKEREKKREALKREAQRAEKKKKLAAEAAAAAGGPGGGGPAIKRRETVNAYCRIFFIRDAGAGRDGGGATAADKAAATIAEGDVHYKRPSGVTSVIPNSISPMYVQ